MVNATQNYERFHHQIVNGMQTKVPLVPQTPNGMDRLEKFVSPGDDEFGRLRIASNVECKQTAFATISVPWSVLPIPPCFKLICINLTFA